MSKLLTIIIPSYNMQDYLPQCLQSLLCESSALVEVLVINDGSKDDTSKVAVDYSRRYPEVIKVIDKPNGNYGSCINRGIKEATGKYVKVLDADDTFDEDCFEDYLRDLANTEAELVINDYVKVWPDRQKVVTSSLQRRIDLDFIKVCERHKELWNIQMHQVCYLRSMLLAIGYHQTEGISYTDQEWTFMPLSAVKTVRYVPLPLYRYTLGREGQTMSAGFSYKHFDDNITCTCAMLQEMTAMDSLAKPVREILQYKLLRRSRFIYRTCLLRLSTKNYSLLDEFDTAIRKDNPRLYHDTGRLLLSKPFFCLPYISIWRRNHNSKFLSSIIKLYKLLH